MFAGLTLIQRQVIQYFESQMIEYLVKVLAA